MSTILHAALDAVFGCRHSQVTRPFTLRRRTYQVCLDCGREIPYSLATMSQTTSRSSFVQAPARETAKAGAL